MITDDFWDLTERPHTEVKLHILEQYLPAWADIILAQWKMHPEWQAYRTPYYIDCFAGRGMFHKDGERDCIKGSPLIALETFLQKQQEYQDKYDLEIRPKCIFVEQNKKFSNELIQFLEPYEGKVDYKIYPRTDVNFVIDEIVSETGYCPAFFFVDPGGVELKKETVYKMASKSGARDIMLNYIADGPRRIGGLAKKMLKGELQEEFMPQHLKTIRRLEDFAGDDVLSHLEDSERLQLSNWVGGILQASNQNSDSKNQLETIVYDMKHPAKNQIIYYLLFATRKNAAKNIMKTIFREAKRTEYTGQTQMDFGDEDDFEV